MQWMVERSRGSAVAFHTRPVPDEPVRTVWLFEVTAPALVLGSTQPDDLVADDLDPAVKVVRRRSGGGAVYLAPGEVVWADVLVPAGDPLHDDDVGRSFHWLGETWRRALGRLGIDARVHEGPVVDRPYSAQVCFAGLGPGEVTVDGHKVVGMSQRRTRAVARFQCAALLEWDPVTTARSLRLDLTRAVAELSRAATGLGVAGPELEAAFLDALPGGWGQGG